MSTTQKKISALTVLATSPASTSFVPIVQGGNTYSVTKALFLASTGIYNVLDYGAAGDNVTDDTTAIQNAINAASAAGGGTVFLPKATYLITSALTLKKNVNITGVGAATTNTATTIRTTSTTTGIFTADVTTTNFEYCTVEKLRLVGPGSGTGNGIYLANTGNAGNHPYYGYMRFRDLYITAFGGYGFYAKSMIVSNLTNVTADSCTTGGFFLNGDGDNLSTYNTVSTSTTFNNCFANNTLSGIGYNIAYCAYISLIGCAADGCGTGYIIKKCNAVSLVSCGVEWVTPTTASPADGYKFDGSIACGLTNCYSYQNKHYSVWVTGTCYAISIDGFQEVTPVSATASLKVDAASYVTTNSFYFTTAKSVAGSELIISDGQGNLTIPSAGSLTVPAYTGFKSAGFTTFTAGYYGTPVNYLGVEAAPTGNATSLIAYGTDTDVSINIAPKGAGKARINFVDIVTTSSADVLTNHTYDTPIFTKWHGWIFGSSTWTYASATTFTVPAADATDMQVGTKIKLTQTTDKFFVVTNVSGTTITVTGGSDYTLVNAAITNPYYSHEANPIAFPDWFNYSPTLVGWSANPTSSVYRFKTTGRQATLEVRQGAATAANATGTTISAPITAATVTNAVWGVVCYEMTDNSVALTTAGRAYIASTGTTVTLANSLTASAMLATGNKAASFMLSYEI